MLASLSIQRFEESGDHWSSLGPQIDFGGACLNLGEYDGARQHFLEALALNEEAGFDQRAFISRWLALVDMKQGNLERALEYCREGIRKGAEITDNNVVASCLALSAGIASKRGQPARAARLSGAAQALYARQRRNAWEDSSLDTLLPGWRDGPDREGILAAFAAGQNLNAEQAAAFALSDAAAT